MRARYAALLLSSVLVLGGCEAVAIGVATPMVIQQKKVNLLNASYAAADTISQQAGKRFLPGRNLVVQDLQEIFHANDARPPIANVDDVIYRASGKAKPSPKLGQVLSSQLRERFTQLGYTVANSSVYQGGGVPGVVSGTYEILGGTMTVALKLVNSDTGQLITTYNYSLPVTYDIKKYMTGSANTLPPLF